jgi:ankyrin repeat protein
MMIIGVQNCRGYHHQLEITKLLLELSPEAAFKRDNAGALPFHRAVKSSSYQVAQLLVSVFPKVRSSISHSGRGALFLSNLTIIIGCICC